MEKRRLFACLCAACVALPLAACADSGQKVAPSGQKAVPQPPSEPSTSARPQAPQLPPAPALNSVAIQYKAKKIMVVGNDVCVFDDDDKLIVFSESVGVSDDHKTLVAEGASIPEGSDFLGSDKRDIQGGFMCGGKNYPATHILGTGLQFQSGIIPGAEGS
ncbi:MAG: hypothetical protein PUK59_03680 [Actinomycetaceae bacterium]|nr:hypothetical protein [Actinomycetaceae bacterium]MDY5854856.1 hypothetical protein [Arcanobacterium sp.]